MLLTAGESVDIDIDERLLKLSPFVGSEFGMFDLTPADMELRLFENYEHQFEKQSAKIHSLIKHS